MQLVIDLVYSPKMLEFSSIPLMDDYFIHMAKLPAELIPNEKKFNLFWELHPKDQHVVKMHGQDVKIPRYSQAFNRDYQFSGNTMSSMPVPKLIEPIFSYAKEKLEPRLNGILANWYHEDFYIGKHRDESKHLIPGCSIYTISFGEERIFRLRPYKKGNEKFDLMVSNGVILEIPYEVNKRFTHEVLRSKKRTGKRISITLRAFVDH